MFAIPGILSQITVRNIVIVRPFGNAIPLSIAREQVNSPFTDLIGFTDSIKDSETELSSLSIMPEAELSEKFCYGLADGRKEIGQWADKEIDTTDLEYGDSIRNTSQQVSVSTLLPPNYVIPNTIRIFNIICAEPVDAINRIVNQPKQTNLISDKAVKQIDIYQPSYDIIVLSGDSIGL